MASPINKITKETERKLIGYSEKIASLVHDGLSPNAAIIKVASENDILPNQTQLLIQAYNNTKFNHQRQSGSSLTEKTAKFEIADPKAIFNELYPSNYKEAAVRADEWANLRGISSDYNKPPDFEKDAFSPAVPTGIAALSVAKKGVKTTVDKYKKFRGITEPEDKKEEKEAGWGHYLAAAALGPMAVPFTVQHQIAQDRKHKSKDEPEEKKKDPLPRDPAHQVKKAWSLLKELDRDYDEKRRQASAAYMKVASAFDDLVYYFKSHYHTPYAEVLDNSVALFGKEAQVVLEHVAAELPKLDKKASARYVAPVDVTKEPYKLVATCIEKAAEHKAADDEFTEFSKQAGESSFKLISEFIPEPPLQYHTGSILKSQPIEKQAFDKYADPITTGMGMAVGQGLLDTVKGTPAGSEIPGMLPMAKPTSKLETKALETVMDPGHQQRLRNIQAQSTFHDLMANDDFLSGEHPDKVSKLYNEITRISPRSANQPLLMRALLRRYLAQGQVDPHDVDQLAGIEGKLKTKDEPMYQRTERKEGA